MLLRNKLNKYLLIEVDEDDKLPKNICIQCCTKLQSVCDFIDTARKAQEVLLQRSFMIDQITPNNCMISLVKTEQKLEPVGVVDNEKYTEMEVSVDPMMVLQNSEATLSPAYDNNVNDVTYLHGLDTENVTIKLIKKGETHTLLEGKAKEKPSNSSGSLNSDDDEKFHLNQHTGAKPYKCPFCDKCFASSGNCYSHRNRMHPGEKHERSLKRTIPTADAPVLRPIAPKPKPAEGPPHNNMATVNGVVKFKCHLCDHSFVKKENFNYHMYQHTGEKPYKCTNCTEKFVTRRGLLIHHDNKHPTVNRPLGLISKNSLLK
ncbi:unnamed protein product [Spodoptera exigua]|nr:unnamed protein product [Spodoptera exigua]